MKTNTKTDRPKKADKDRIAAVIAAILILLFLGGSVFIGLTGSGIAGDKKSLISDKYIEEADLLMNPGSSEDNITVLALDEDITITPNGVSAQPSAKADTSSDGDYILPDSGTKYLTDADVSGLSKQELKLARNEIIARHGRKFESQDIKEYFESKSWYNGSIDPDTFDANINSYLSAVEFANIDLIKKYE